MKISVKSQENGHRRIRCGPRFLYDRLKRSGQGRPSRVPFFCGGGGKTSYIRRLAWEGREKGCRVLVMTTTHMAVPNILEYWNRIWDK